MIVQTDNSIDLGPAIELPLTKGKVALISPGRRKDIGYFKWCAKKSHSKFYAMRKIRTGGKVKYLLMHRVIANTPDNQLCHHKNGNSLDNRRLNLENMSPFEQAKFFSWR